MVIDILKENDEITIFFHGYEKGIKITGEELLSAIYFFRNTKAEMEEENEGK